MVFLNPPDEPVSGYPLRVSYSCDKPMLVHLECIVSFDTGKTSTVLQRNWKCEPGPTRIHSLILRLPDWLVYKPDWAVPVSQWVHSAMLRASLRDYGSTFSLGTSSAQRAVAVLQITPPLSRPLKQHRLCPDWRVQMLTKTTAMPKCPSEQGNVDIGFGCSRKCCILIRYRTDTPNPSNNIPHSDGPFAVLNLRLSWREVWGYEDIAALQQ